MLCGALYGLIASVYERISIVQIVQDDIENNNQDYKLNKQQEEKLKLMDKFIEDNKTKFVSNDLLFSSKLKK